MSGLRKVRSVAMAAVILTCACKKSEEGGAARAERPFELVARPAALDPARLSVPALFAHVPADTPVMFGSFEPIPLEFWAKLKNAFGPVVDLATAQMRADGEPEGDPLYLAFREELGGEWTAQGLEKLGLDATPRFALYRLDQRIIVLRLEIRDGNAVTAAIERLAQRAQLSLPTRSGFQGRELWRFPGEDHDVVLAVVDEQLVIAGGPAEDLDRSLGLILGSEKPRASMSDGALLAKLAVKHGFGPHVIGYFDLERLVQQELENAGRTTPTCAAAIHHVTGRVPRIVFGYGPLDAGTVWSGGLAFELAPDLVSELKSLEVEVPGLEAAFTGRELFAVGVGVDLERGRRLVRRAATALRDLSEACASPAAVMFADLATRLAAPLPAPLSKISGAAFAIEQMTFGSAGSDAPEMMDGVAFVTGTDGMDGKALFAELDRHLGLSQVGVAADGQLHEIHDPGPMPLHAGVGRHSVVFAAGRRAMVQRAEKLLDARPHGLAPLLSTSFDVGRILQLELQRENRDDVPRDVMAAFGKALGHAAATFHVTDHGITGRATVQLK